MVKSVQTTLLDFNIKILLNMSVLDDIMYYLFNKNYINIKIYNLNFFLNWIL